MTENNITTLMHRFVCNYELTDHENRDRTDNRKSNLRDANALKNARNRSVQSNNTQEITGVYYRKERNSWYAQITIKGKTKTLIYTHDKKEAIIARLKAEKEFYGEFAPQKHLFEEYDI